MAQLPSTETRSSLNSSHARISARLISLPFLASKSTIGSVPSELEYRPAPATPGSLSPGTRVGQGRFILKQILGRGGMGMVWLAHANHLNEFVALTFLPPQIRFATAAIDLLRRETTRSRKLSHPNIIRIHDLHRHEGEDRSEEHTSELQSRFGISY